jgi:hypothetical protein
MLKLNMIELVLEVDIGYSKMGSLDYQLATVPSKAEHVGFVEVTDVCLGSTLDNAGIGVVTAVISFCVVSTSSVTA